MSQKKAFVLVCRVVLLLVGALNVHAVTKVGRFAYTVEGGNVVAYAMNSSTGQLSVVQVLPVLNSGWVIVHPSNRFLYVPSGSSSIAGFRIGTNGTLTALAGSPFATSFNSAFIVFTPSGKFGYTETYPGSNVEILSVNTTSGAITSIGSVVPGSRTSDLAMMHKGNFLYTFDNGTSDVSGFAINATTGALTAVPGSPFAAGPGCASGWITPSGKFVYAANFDGTISGYSINATTGTLTQISGSPFPGPTFSGGNLRGTPNGHFLYNGLLNAGGIAAFAIDQSTGALTSVAGSPFAAGTIPTAALVDPSSQFAYVPNYGGQQPLLTFSINSTTGALTQIGSQGLVGAQAAWFSYTSGAALKFSPTFAYVTNLTSGSITELNIAGGGLSVIGTVTDTNGPQVSTSTPNHKFLYTGNINGSISEYSIPATGLLKKVAGSPITGLTDPIGLAIGPFYNALYAEDPTADLTFDYTINPKTGSLTNFFTGPTAGTGPDAIALDPFGAFTLVTNNGSNNIGIGIPGTGFVSTIGTGIAPAAISIDPSNQYVYVANDDGTLWGYSLTLASPYLTPLPGSPWGVGVTPLGIATDLWGRYLYVANAGGTISAFSIDPLSGALTPIGGGVIPGGNPSSLAVSNDAKYLYVTDKGNGVLNSFTINSDGSLSSLGSVVVGTLPTSVTAIGTYK